MDDLLRLNAQFTEEERMVRDSVAQFVEQDVTPIIADAFESATFPKKWTSQAAELGLFGLTLPENYGGAGASYVAYGLVCQELERGDSGLRSLVSVQSSLCMFPIYQFGTEAQKQRYLKPMALGQCIGCFGLTEANSGSDPGSMHTHATKKSGGWSLNGAKMWITNAPIADIGIIWAKTEHGIRGFIVDLKTKGVTRQEIKKKMSLRASLTGELAFDNVFVPDENYLSGTEKGLSAALACLNQARYGIAWGAVGAAEACIDLVTEYLSSRKQFEKSLTSFQLIQQSLAEMYTEIVKAKCVNLQVGRLKDQHAETPAMISLIKRNACREALKIARTCRNLLGANGISLEFHVIRHMLNLESVFTYEGTDNVHTLILGRHITGVNAFS